MTINDQGEGEMVYTVFVTQLNNQFLPKVNKTYERSVFRAMSKSESETVDQFITRLRQKAIYCDFANTDEMIRDQVIEKCVSHRLRRKLLELPNVTLQRLRGMTVSFEN